MNTFVRSPEIQDLDQIEEIVKSNPSMYGADITKNHDCIIARFMGVPVENEPPSTPWCVEVDGVIQGLALQYWWNVLPVWSIGALFFKNNPGANQFNAVKLGAPLINAMCKCAESRGVNDFYYVVRDTIKSDRKNMSLNINPELESRYYLVDLFMLKPFQIPDSVIYKNMLGLVQGRNTKSVVFRQGHLKNEFRNIWQ